MVSAGAPEARAHAVLRAFLERRGNPDPWSLVPTPLDEIAADRGWAVGYVPGLHAGGEEMAGEIDPDTKAIFVSLRWPPDVQRFTLAHELGHSVLHPKVVAHRDPPMFGDESRARRTLSPEEREANRFAAELLMPRNAVRRMFEGLFGTPRFSLSDLTEDHIWHVKPHAGKRFSRMGPRDMTVRDLSEMLAQVKGFGSTHFGMSLAQRFQVSVLAAAIRLEELGLVVG